MSPRARLPEVQRVPEVPAGYRLTETGETALGAMWTAYGPTGTLGSCGGGSGRNAGAINARRAASMCFEDYGRRVHRAALVHAADECARQGHTNESIREAFAALRAALAAFHGEG